jgi:hypothetical protein
MLEIKSLTQFLPTAEIGTAFFTVQIMYRIYAFAIGMVVLGSINFGITTVVTNLDKATAEQCRTHDWPSYQHYTHMEWCLDNGYSTN